VIESARRLVDQKLGSVGVWISLVALDLLGALLLITGQSSTGLVTVLAVFVVTAGIVSRDAASGALQMILSRPILRAQYLYGRYLAALTLLAGFLVSVFATAVLIDRAAALAGWTGDSAFVWKEALTAVAADFPRAALDAAILLFFSTFLRGLGDALAFVLSGIVLNLVPQIAMALRNPGLARIARRVISNVVPDGAWGSILHGGPVLQEATGEWALAIAVYLFLALVIFNRRELSYGQD
jgi:ABC-type transport system involved in multi-copper enzyme maturation permease subunit